MILEPATVRLLSAAKAGEAFLETGDSRYRADFLQRGWIVKASSSSGLVQIEVPTVRYAYAQGWIARDGGKVRLTPAGEAAWLDLALVTA